MVQDPCTGQWVDAGECGFFQECGAGNTTVEGIGTIDGFYNEPERYNPIPNICGNSCVEHRVSFASDTCYDGQNYAVVCVEEYFGSQVPVPDGCEEGTRVSYSKWCCR